MMNTWKNVNMTREKSKREALSNPAASRHGFDWLQVAAVGANCRGKEGCPV